MEKQVMVPKADFRKADYPRFRVVADVGATNTYVAIMGVKSYKSYSIIFRHSYKTKEIRHIHEALNLALKEGKEDYDIETGIACIGAAGPISRQRNYIKLTNADLEISIQEIYANSLLSKVILINDFESVGYGIDILNIENDAVLIPHVGEDLTRKATFSNPVAVIGAVSGLGMAIAPYNPKKLMHAPIPSEGGHIDFTPYNEEEFRLVQYLKDRVLTKKSVQPETERLVSADGIAFIYDFLTQNVKNPLVTGISGITKTKAIEENYSNDEYCKKSIDMFITFYARAARSLALMSECYSGLFLTGKAILIHREKILQKEFMETFEQHDKRSDVLRKIPVYLVTNNDVGLYGCCNVTVNFFNI